jgi:nitrogen-specific signal transduction histidine kinase
MWKQYVNVRNILGALAILFVVASILFTNRLSKKIALQEKQKVEQYVAAVKDLYNVDNMDTKLASKIIGDLSNEIPLIQTNENDSIVSHNLDTIKIARNKNYLQNQLADFKATNPPIVWSNPLNPAEKTLTYYGESTLLVQIRYFPIVQLVVALLFIIIILIATTTKNKSTQNQVWAGLAKEAAHQLGTPISSLQGWLEVLRETAGAEKYAIEIEKDVERLKLVSERFGKIGSKPKLEPTNIVLQIQSMVDYIKKRAPQKVQFTLTYADPEILANINAPLFDWVIENLLKNALDAMDGTGTISILVKDEITQTIVEVKDTGKGIAKKNIANVFKPGFTTKQRGWGLGLSLSKRIVEVYHKGELNVKNSEVGVGTTFKVLLRKA